MNMKKKFFTIMLAAAMAVNFGVLPTMAESNEGQEAEATDASEETEDSTGEADPSLEEGYTEDGDSYTSVVAWAKNGENDIYGKFYYPADFDSTQQYTTVVLNHGGGVNADFWDKCYAPELAKQGYVCYTFECRSATDGGRGVFSDPNEDGTCSIATYSEDLNAAMDLMESKEYVDKSHLYLMGQSMGGATVQNVAAARNDEVAGVIVLYGSVSDDNADMLPKDDSELKISFNDKMACFVFGDYKMTSTLVEGRFPNYNSVIPQNNPKKIIIEKKELYNSLRRVSVMANQASNLVKFDVAEGKIVISAQDMDYSMSGHETLTCQYEGENIAIGFKSPFVLEILSNIESENVVLELSDPTRPGLFLPFENEDNDEDLLMLLMPMMV